MKKTYLKQKLTSLYSFILQEQNRGQTYVILHSKENGSHIKIKQNGKI